jgi:hypothetical protein
MTGRRELREVTRFSAQRRGFEPQCDCLPPETRDALHFVLVDSIDEVFDAAFSANGAGANGRGRAAAARIGAPFNPQGKDRR